MSRLWTDEEPIMVVTDDGDAPVSFTWQGRVHPVVRVVEQWELQTDWWSEAGEVSRRYFKLITRGGLLCEIYLDLLAGPGEWRMAKLYD
jgi:hypothetical protein